MKPLSASWPEQPVEFREKTHFLLYMDIALEANAKDEKKEK